MNAPAPAPAHFAADRVEMPAILLAEDVARFLGLKTASAARRAMRQGECGPCFRRGRRLLVRREVFLAAILAREGRPGRTLPRWAPAFRKRARHGRGSRRPSV